jgi:hypothetical protein
MLFRKLKFIPTLVDICKRILICPKNEFKHLGKAIELSIKIISVFIYYSYTLYIEMVIRSLAAYKTIKRDTSKSF